MRKGLLTVALCGFLAACSAVQNGSFDPDAQFKKEVLVACTAATGAIRLIKPRIATMSLKRATATSDAIQTAKIICDPGTEVPSSRTALNALLNATAALTAGDNQ